MRGGLAECVAGRVQFGYAHLRANEIAGACGDRRVPVTIVIDGVQTCASRAARVGVEHFGLHGDGASAGSWVNQLERFVHRLADREEVGAASDQAPW